MADVSATPSEDGRELTIKINGRFDFGSHQPFRDAYERHAPKPEKVIIDLKDATYLDSSALGMLLLLRDYAGGENANIQLINASSDTKKILAISNFNQLFEVT
jgi:anti-anti-sigma factor